MTIRTLMKQTAVVGLLALSGCEATRGMRDDLARLTTSQPAAQKPPARTGAGQPPSRPRTASSGPATSTEVPPSMTVAPAEDRPAAASSASPAELLAGKSETEVRALFGAPTSEEERPPGKRWHYQDGQCRLDVQLYPDVRTKQFGTLAYEVKSDDNSDEGKRLCLAQLRSRAQNRN